MSLSLISFAFGFSNLGIFDILKLRDSEDEIDSIKIRLKSISKTNQLVILYLLHI